MSTHYVPSDRVADAVYALRELLMEPSPGRTLDEEIAALSAIRRHAQ